MTNEEEWRRACNAFRQAQAYFEVADPDMIDVAIYELAAAEKRLDALLRRLKQGVVA